MSRKVIAQVVCDGCGKPIELDAEGNLPAGAGKIRIDEVGSEYVRTLDFDAECLSKLPEGTKRKRRAANGDTAETPAEPAKDAAKKK